jgi:syntaxin 1B/2/3
MESKRKSSKSSKRVAVPSGDAAEISYDAFLAELKLLQSKSKALKSVQLAAADQKSRESTHQNVDRLIDEGNKSAVKAASELNAIKKLVWKHKSEPLSELRENLFQKHAMELQDCSDAWKTVVSSAKTTLHDSKLRIVENAARAAKQELKTEDLETIVRAGQAETVVQQLMLMDNDEGAETLRNLVRDIEQRHGQVLRLEQQVLELAQLMQDLACLVDMQQEPLDQIERNILSAKKHAEQGEDECRRANGYAKSARNKQCAMLACGVVALAAVSGGVTGAVKSA